MNNGRKTSAVQWALTAAFAFLAIAFLVNVWGRTPALPDIPLVEPEFITNTPIRISYSELVRTKEDLSDFDCYGCHDKKSPPPVRYDTNHNLIIPKEHENITMGHGRHNRNNHCYNCHDEHNLEQFESRDGRQLTFAESTPLCGSCHGPTYRDWDAGAHGRTTGSWIPASAESRKLDCVECHNPHSPKIPSRKPAPGPHPLRQKPAPHVAKTETQH